MFIVICKLSLHGENPTTFNNIQDACSLVYPLILSMTMKIDVSLGEFTIGTEVATHPIGEVLKSSKTGPDGKANQTQKKLNAASQ